MRDRDRKKLFAPVKLEIKKFPINIQFATQDTLDQTFLVMVKEYLVLCNGYIIAHFVDEASFKSYHDMLNREGINYFYNHFPKNILEILEGMHNKNYQLKKVQDDKNANKG